MLSRQIEIKNKKGLHARAAAKLISVTTGFDSEILISKGDNEVSGKSILGLLMLAAHQGTWITVIANGPDEGDAIEEISKLIESNFQESE